MTYNEIITFHTLRGTQKCSGDMIIDLKGNKRAYLRIGKNIFLWIRIVSNVSDFSDFSDFTNSVESFFSAEIDVILAKLTSMIDHNEIL